MDIDHTRANTLREGNFLANFLSIVCLSVIEEFEIHLV